MAEHFEGESDTHIIGPFYGQRGDGDPPSPPEHERVERVHNGRGDGPGEGPPRRDDGPRRSGGRGRWVLAAVGVIVLAFGAGIGGAAVDHHWIDNGSSHASDTISSAQPVQPSNANATGKTPVSTTASGGAVKTPGQIYSEAAPSVVNVTSKGTTTNESLFGFPQTEESEATGSGIVVDTAGHIVTNDHVIAGASNISVSFSDGKQIKATVVGSDASDDLAVLKVDASDVKGLTPLTFADSTAVKVGDPVVAIGNPFDLDRTLTSGIVSALQRQIQGLNGYEIDNVIQTDAAINPGNSGGPLLNSAGQVIGINSQIATATTEDGSSSGDDGNIGIGFAIPSNTVKRIAQQLIDKGSVAHAFLGVEGSDVDSTVAGYFHLPENYGVLVADVTKGSPAAGAGLKGGSTDVTIDGNDYELGGSQIVQFDGTKITGMDQLQELVGDKNPGTSATIVFYNGNSKKTATVKLATRPASADSSSTQSQQGQGDGGGLGGGQSGGGLGGGLGSGGGDGGLGQGFGFGQ